MPALDYQAGRLSAFRRVPRVYPLHGVPDHVDCPAWRDALRVLRYRCWAFGAGLGGKWKFPRHLRAVMGYHHSPEQLDEDNLALVNIIRLADILCCRAKLGFYLTSQNAALEPEHLVAVGVNSDQIAEVIEQLPEQISVAESMMS